MTSLLTTYQRLFNHFGCRNWWPAETPFEVAVGAILTQNTNWSNVEKAIANLRAADALSCAALCALPTAQLEEFIRPSGFFRQKAQRLQLFAEYLRDNYQSSLEKMLQQPLEPLREELLSRKGIGQETADSILLYAGGHLSFVVDAYTARLFGRLGRLDGTEKYLDIRRLFMSQLAADVEMYNEFHALIVIQCKEYCRKKPLCTHCPLKSICAYQQLNP